MSAASTIALRDYQIEACDRVDALWRSGVTNLANVLPTGSGKTTIAMLIADLLIVWLDPRARAKL